MCQAVRRNRRTGQEGWLGLDGLCRIFMYKDAGKAGGCLARKQGRCMFGKKNGKGWEDGTVVYCGEKGRF